MICAATQIYDGDSSTLGLEVTVTLTNVGTDILSNLCYTRNVDPDQEQPWTSDYATSNSIYYQPTKPEGINGNANPFNFAAVVSRGSYHTDLVQIMLTSDSRARAAYDVFSYGFTASPAIDGLRTVCGVWCALRATAPPRLLHT